MSESTKPKATLYIHNGEQVMGSIDIHNLAVESDWPLRSYGQDRVDVSLSGTASSNLLPLIMTIKKRPDYVEKRVFPPFKWVRPENLLPKISRVIFNYPATVVFWDDGTKTVVKCQLGDVYDKEKGLMACMLKRFMGNDNTFNKVLNRWVKEDA